ncbi:MAG: hypothetical protein KatS3mg099_042 [Candidatus Parcubacteria bacterium]|nr:MAG: hypothetical protein KatS3mg099_042 [Candidatus Parcubacteria bacterium]
MIRRAVLSLLLPREEYEREARKYPGDYFVFERKTAEQVLYYFGANHSRDPKNPQYPALKKYWKEFLRATAGRERVVLIEGGLRKLERTEKTAITKAGAEGGLVTLLAHQAGVRVACPDIDEETLMEQSSNLNKDEVLLYWFLSWLDNFQTHPEPKPDFEKAALLHCRQTAKRKMWTDVDVSLPRLKHLYKQVLAKEFDETVSPNDFINPNKTETPINKIARVFSDMRDAHIVTTIEKYWNESKNLFVVFGRGHLIIQKPALETLLK